MPLNPLPTIGWHERIDLPDWGLRRIKTKIDTVCVTEHDEGDDD